METRRYWKQQGRRVARRHNFGWWLAAFLRFSTAACVGFAIALLLMRQADLRLREAWIGFAALLVLGALIAWWRERPRFFSVSDGLVRLDLLLGLNNRLTAAWAGVGEFPPAQKGVDGWRWRWISVVPVVGSALLVAAAMGIPVGRPSAAAHVEPPSALAQVESWVEQLDKSGLVEKKPLEELREKLESLKDRPKEEWYSASALEAGDSLREQAGDAIRALQRDLQNSSATLAAMQELGAGMTAVEMKAARQALDQALQGLEMGKMPLDRKLLGKLKTVDFSKMKTLTPEQFAAMQKRLKEGAGVCEACVGGTLGEKVVLAQIPGPPAVARGPGTLPLDLSPQRTELVAPTTAALPDADMGRALPGDVVGMAAGEHRVDKEAFTGSTAAGAVSSAGAGGEAVWRDSLNPDEREMLKRFFK